MIVFRWGVESEPALAAHFATAWVANTTIAAVFIAIGIGNRMYAKSLQKKINALDDI
jgi:hypothetical protein